MTRDPSTRGEEIQSHGSLMYLLGVPLVIVLFVGVPLILLKGSEIVHEHVPDLPPLVDVFVLIVLVGMALYGVFRIGDLVQR